VSLRVGNWTSRTLVPACALAIAILGAACSRGDSTLDPPALVSDEILAADAVPIRIAVHNWSSQRAGAHVVGRTLEQAGFAVEYVDADNQGVYAQACAGEVDVVHEVWETFFGDSFDAQVQAGCVLEWATHFATTGEGWWYPVYIEQQCPGLPDWEALNACAELFAVADTGTQGQYLAAPAVWEKADQLMVEGLQLDFEVKNVDDPAELLQQLEAANATETPIVMFNWRPNYIQSLYPGKFVEFPEYDDDCWVDPTWGPNPDLTHDCGNPNTGAIKIAVGSQFPIDWPEAAVIVQQINFSNDDLSALASGVDAEGLDPAAVADRWIAENESTVMSWVNAG